MLELISIPAILAAVEASKMAGLDSKYAAIEAICIGLIFGFIVEAPLTGLIFGLSASGLYSGVKAFINK